MANPFRGKAFRALEREWNERLAASGFQDVERAGSWLHDRVFRTRTQRRVWELHSEGASMRDIRIALGPMRMRQLRRILEVIKRERAALVQHLANLPVEPHEAPSLHQQHLDAEGYTAGSYDDASAGPGDPMRRIQRAFERRDAEWLLERRALASLMVHRRFWS